MAIERPHLGKFKEQKVVYVHVIVPRAEIEPAMRSALGEIGAALKAQGVPPAGPWFAHHHRRPSGTFDFDVCFPVETDVALSGRLALAVIPETDVVRTAFHGPYTGLPAAWGEFVAAIEAHGYKIREDAFEVYSIGPGDDPTPDAWQTDLIYPLAETAAGKDCTL